MVPVHWSQKLPAGQFRLPGSKSHGGGAARSYGRSARYTRTRGGGDADQNQSRGEEARRAAEGRSSDDDESGKSGTDDELGDQEERETERTVTGYGIGKEHIRRLLYSAVIAARSSICSGSN